MIYHLHIPIYFNSFILFCFGLFHSIMNINKFLTLYDRGSEWGPYRSWGAAATAIALWPGQGGTRHPGGHGLEHHGR